MKKRHKEEEELNDSSINKHTENKEHNKEQEDESERRFDSVESAGETPSDSGVADESAATADKVVAEATVSIEKLAEMQDKYIRLSAEFDNYRKRTLREKIDLSKYAAEEILLKLVPILDDFERALLHMDSTDDCEAIKDGIILIYSKFSEFLKQSGVKEIESLNNNFDVDLHDAVAKVPVEDVDMKGKVVDVIQKGYYFQDKVLRHSKVVVGE